ncbi:hypothetical protein Daus18300_002336 [Diaporthe australafricana]|uniref:Endonuclease/exonuclease/phosphatase domain-containing protein n=1 Tax=Diaporthe australafricana TaxID=127596 RepID=A0ABR3XPR9_9PEZI
MSITSIRTRCLAWYQSTPLPILPDAPPTFQAWHTFDESIGKWTRLQTSSPPQQREQIFDTQSSEATSEPTSLPTLTLATWNVDAFGESHEARMEGIVSKLRDLQHPPDIIFLQEVSPKALTCILNNTWIRQGWMLSDIDDTSWAGVQFATLTLLSRGRFNGTPDPSTSADSSLFSAGPIWRVNYPSRFKRDALCCDVFHHNARIRLVNVHLDSLPIQPNQRPRQVEIAAQLIRQAGVDYGLVAGDFNPVSAEDVTVISDNGLVDAWEATHPGEDGFTWGLAGSGAPFPPGRFDKVAVVGLRPKWVEVIPAGLTSTAEELGEIGAPQGEGKRGPDTREDSGQIPWSDHSGVLAELKLAPVGR